MLLATFEAHPKQHLPTRQWQTSVACLPHINSWLQMRVLQPCHHNTKKLVTNHNKRQLVIIPIDYCAATSLKLGTSSATCTLPTTFGDIYFCVCASGPT